MAAQHHDATLNEDGPYTTPLDSTPAAACLHWGVRREEVYLDPLRLIGHWQVRLKTWDT